jgi:small subunit ribosomal protein S11
MTVFAKKQGKPGFLYIVSSKNNTLLTLTDVAGRPQVQTSVGRVGFRHARKSTAYGAQRAMEDLVEKALARGFTTVEVMLRGFGYGKDSSLRSLGKSPLQVTMVHEQTPTAHNGCRRPRRRRL